MMSFEINTIIYTNTGNITHDGSGDQYWHFLLGIQLVFYIWMYFSYFPSFCLIVLEFCMVSLIFRMYT